MSARCIIRILSVAAATTSGTLSGPLDSTAAHADPCPDVEVVFARGTGQDVGLGEVGQAFVDSLGSQIIGRSMSVYPVNYPATADFASSALTGADDVVAHVNDMIGRCPDTRLVLGGFSQGAGVMDLATRALPSQAVDHVAAIAIFGNPPASVQAISPASLFRRSARRMPPRPLTCAPTAIPYAPPLAATSLRTARTSHPG